MSSSEQRPLADEEKEGDNSTPRGDEESNSSSSPPPLSSSPLPSTTLSDVPVEDRKEIISSTQQVIDSRDKDQVVPSPSKQVLVEPNMLAMRMSGGCGL